MNMEAHANGAQPVLEPVALAAANPNAHGQAMPPWQHRPWPLDVRIVFGVGKLLAMIASAVLVRDPIRVWYPLLAFDMVNDLFWKTPTFEAYSLVVDIKQPVVRGLTVFLFAAVLPVALVWLEAHVNKR